MQKKIDLLHGNLYSALLWFALPFLAANLIQVLYGTVDLLVVGWYNSEAQISAVSLGSQITQLLLSFITGLTMGSTVLIAQYAGNGKERDIEASIATTFTLFLLLGILLTVVMLVMTPQLQTGNQQKIEYDITYAGYRDKIQRTFGISQPSENSTDSIITKAENNAHAAYINITAGILVGFLRCLNEP